MTTKESVLVIKKPVGVTPYQLIKKLKEYKKYKNEKLGYAGRLDPQAEGVMLVLVGNENKNRKSYERLPKEYIFDVLFGISTDTYDIMGIPKFHKQNHNPGKIKIKPGSFTQPYPPYSYIKVSGKPLYWWARNGRLAEIAIPKKKVTVYKSSAIKHYKLSFKKINSEVQRRVSTVEGDFRQKEILSSWRNLFRKHKDASFHVVRLKISCSSGTYVRAIAHDLGKTKGSGALAYKITRLSVGKYSKNSVISLYEAENRTP